MNPSANTSPGGRRLLIATIFLATLGGAAGALAREDAGPVPFTPSQLGRSASHLLDTDLVIVLGVSTLTAIVVSNWDQEIVDWFVENEPLGSDGTEIGWRIGHRETVFWTSAGLTGLGLIFRDPYLRNTGLLVAEANLVSAGTSQLIKLIAGRERPDGSNNNSFPSGHATAAMTSATVLGKRYGWKAGIITYPLAIYTGLSRIQGEKHYLSDVLVGWAIGYWIASAAVRGSEATPEELAESSHKKVSWMPRPEPTDQGMPVLRIRF